MIRPPPWNRINQLPECFGDFAERAVNIGVVKLDIVDNERFGKVVKKLGPAAKYLRAVVFVAFDNHVLAGAEGGTGGESCWLILQRETTDLNRG